MKSYTRDRWKELNADWADTGETCKDDLVTVFEALQVPFIVRLFCCDNPECDCRHVKLGIGAVDGSLSTTLRLDVFTWKEMDEPKRNPQNQRLIDEFKRDMTVEAQKIWREAYDEAQDLKKTLQSSRIDRAKLAEGLMVSWLSVIGSKAVTEGGQDASYSFDHDGKNYVVVDLYCPDPDCDCNEVLLMFLVANDETKLVSSAFRTRVEIGKSIESTHETIVERVSKREAHQIYRAFVEAHPHLMSEFERHDRDVKYVARRSLGEKTAKPARSMGSKVGRNAPCPCGSGKKYKKCCMAKE